jgi:hypothetical protein
VAIAKRNQTDIVFSSQTRLLAGGVRAAQQMELDHKMLRNERTVLLDFDIPH